MMYHNGLCYTTILKLCKRASRTGTNHRCPPTQQSCLYNILCDACRFLQGPWRVELLRRPFQCGYCQKYRHCCASSSFSSCSCLNIAEPSQKDLNLRFQARLPPFFCGSEPSIPKLWPQLSRPAAFVRVGLKETLLLLRQQTRQITWMIHRDRGAT